MPVILVFLPPLSSWAARHMLYPNLGAPVVGFEAAGKAASGDVWALWTVTITATKVSGENTWPCTALGLSFPFYTMKGGTP